MRCMTEEVVGEKSWWQLSMGENIRTFMREKCRDGVHEEL